METTEFYQTQEESRVQNEELFEMLGSSDSGTVKRAVDAVNDFTRYKIREEGFFGKILPPVPISNSELDRMPHTDKPVKTVDREPDSPAAMSVPFATQPDDLYIEGPRYVVAFDRILSRRFRKDVDELRTWHMDIRQVLSDNAIKDMLAEEDGKFIAAVNKVLVGANVVLPTSGVAQYQTIAGGIDRDTLWDSMKILNNTPSNLETKTVLINHVTIKDVCKAGGDEMGNGSDSLSADIMRNGWTLENFMGVKWIITIKRGLVPTNTMYHFPAPKFIGKFYVLEDTTMYIRREAYFIEFFAYKTCGASIGNYNALGRVDFV